jgi:hypothetical protein
MSIAIIVALLWSVIGLFIYRVSRQRQRSPHWSNKTRIAATAGKNLGAP